MDRKDLLINGAIALLVLFIVYKLINKIGQSLGLADSEEDKEIDKELSGKMFDFNTLKPTDKVLGYKYGLQQANKIDKAIGNFYDDESEILAVFKQLDLKSEVKSLAYWYNRLTKRDLGTDLRRNLNDKEMLSITNYVNKLR